MVNSAGFPRKKGAQLYDFATIVRICFEVFGVDLWVQLLKFGESCFTNFASYLCFDLLYMVEATFINKIWVLWLSPYNGMFWFCFNVSGITYCGYDLCQKFC